MFRADHVSAVQTWLYHADLVGDLPGRWPEFRSHGESITARSIRNTRRAGSDSQYVSPRASPDGSLPASSVAARHRGIPMLAWGTIRADAGDPERFRPLRFSTEPGGAHAFPRGTGTRRAGHRDRHDRPICAPQESPSFIDAAKTVSERCSSVHFVMAGTGVDRDNADLAGPGSGKLACRIDFTCSGSVRICRH